MRMAILPLTVLLVNVLRNLEMFSITFSQYPSVCAIPAEERLIVLHVDSGFHCHTIVSFSFAVSCGKQLRDTLCDSLLLWFVLGPALCHLLGSIDSFHS